jgi:iron complex transport system ATP-binding protein
MMKSDLAMTNGLHIQDVSFSYRRQSEVLKNLSFSVPRGRVVGILGANGAGKSTLFKLILGVLPLQSGEIKINGRSVKTLSNRERAKQMAYIPQTQRGTFQFTVAEMVLMGTTASFSMF